LRTNRRKLGLGAPSIEGNPDEKSEEIVTTKPEALGE
jgi:hypothetical protein